MARKKLVQDKVVY